MNPGAKLARLEHGLEALARVVGEALLLLVKEVRVRLRRASSDATAQLVQLGEAELPGAVDDDRVDVRDVETGLDDRGADEDVVLRVGELDHHALEPSLIHLTVTDDEARLRDQGAEALRLVLDRPARGCGRK